MALYDILDNKSISPRSKIRAAHEASFWMAQEGRSLSPGEYRNIVSRIADTDATSLDTMMPLLAAFDDGYATDNQFYTEMNHVGFSILLKDNGYELPSAYRKAA